MFPAVWSRIYREQIFICEPHLNLTINRELNSRTIQSINWALFLPTRCGCLGLRVTNHQIQEKALTKTVFRIDKRTFMAFLTFFGWRGASTDAFWCNWHCLPIGFTAVSNSRSMLGHQTWARALILEMPWWASCSSSISWVCCFDGTITCVFQNTHLPSVVNSFFWLQYGCNLLSWQWCSHALSVNWYRITSCPFLNARRRAIFLFIFIVSPISFLP